MREELIRVEHVSKYFAGVKALDDVSFSINRGEIRGLVGENGSGKSTMIKIIAGVYEPDRGDIYINGKHYKRLTPIASIQEGIQVIYQDFSLFPNLTVAENIGINRVISKGGRVVNWKEVYESAKEGLSRVGTDISLDAITGKLPAADRQIIAIARALLEDARLIIMDEPTTALTQREIQYLFKTIKDLKKQGISILFVSHKLNEVKEISDSVLIFRDGKKVLDQEAEELDIKTMEYYMTGRRIDTSSIAYSEPEEAPPLLKVKNLNLNPYFSGISFELKPKEVLGITGLLGSGRTELALSLFGELPAESGEIWLEGKEIFIRRNQDAIKEGIAYVPEDRINEGLFLEQPISDNLIVTIADYLASKLGIISNQAKLKTAEEWVDRLEIKTPSVENPVSSLSGGNQQRVVLAKWLASNPKLLILNGPTVGVDVGSKTAIHELIRDLAKQGMGIILISDDIPELIQTCNRILLMRNGKIAEEFQREKVNEEELHRHLVAAKS
ncbi:MAG: simple sugar transport system ATP-binding protein [Candidatus Atribacteria bacterium]|nr:simple sugar transport system ATP-binding protein [Candidatus Atribacteria bacterium]